MIATVLGNNNPKIMEIHVCHVLFTIDSICIGNCIEMKKKKLLGDNSDFSLSENVDCMKNVKTVLNKCLCFWGRLFDQR